MMWCNLFMKQLCTMIEDHKERKDPEPLMISKNTVKHVLESCGVSEPHVAAFDEQYDTEFGAETQITPKNLIDTKQLRIRTPDVTIQVNPERRDLVETRIIDGTKYILIRADEGVEVNGIQIHIPERGKIALPASISDLFPHIKITEKPLLQIWNNGFSFFNFYAQFFFMKFVHARKYD